MSIGKYILVDREPVPVPCEHLLLWADWMERARRRVALTQVGPCTVSTVFLGLDHNYFGGPPLLFETMVFVPDDHTEVFELGGRKHELRTRSNFLDICQRCST